VDAATAPTTTPATTPAAAAPATTATPATTPAATPATTTATPATTTPAASASGGRSQGRGVVDVKTKGPASIRWLDAGGKVLGFGTGTFKIAANAKSIGAVDSRRGVKSTVAISGGVADYGTLPRGKIQPRANPFADVFLGSDALGQTPIAPVDCVAGTYTVRFVHDGKEQKKTVEVKAGDVVRVAADFGG
jgi:hypothetical protein